MWNRPASRTSHEAVILAGDCPFLPYPQSLFFPFLPGCSRVGTTSRSCMITRTTPLVRQPLALEPRAFWSGPIYWLDKSFSREELRKSEHRNQCSTPRPNKTPKIPEPLGGRGLNSRSRPVGPGGQQDTHIVLRVLMRSHRGVRLPGRAPSSAIRVGERTLTTGLSSGR